MQASKENCEKAIRVVVDTAMTPETPLLLTDYQFLKEFLEAVHSRLPYASTLDRDKQNRRKRDQLKRIKRAKKV